MKGAPLPPIPCAVESCGHVNVNDVDAAVLCRFHRCLDREIQGSRRAVDLGLEAKVRIALDKLKQKRIASDHDERVGRRVCHLRIQVCETAPEHTLAPRRHCQQRKCSIDCSLALCGVGGTAVQAASTRRDPNQPHQRSESPTLCLASAPTTAPRPHRTSLPRCRRRWRGDGSCFRRRATRDSRSGSAGSC